MMDPEKFNEWLSTFTQDVDFLSSEQKTTVLDCLINKSDPRNLYHLSTKLEIYTKRDFLALLPLELSEKLLCYLDWPMLLACQATSHKWREVTDAASLAWKKACVQIGVVVSEDSQLSAQEYRERLQMVYHQRKALASGEAFEEMTLEGHTGDVRAIHCRDGKVATGSEDRTVRVWDSQTGQCLRKYAAHSVACVRLDESWFLTASYDCTLAMWDLDSGSRLRTYTGHVAAVFALDYLKDADLLVSGSADRTVKVWSLTTGEILKSLDPKVRTWVYEVGVSRSPEAFYKDGYYVTCMTSEVDKPHVYTYNVWLLDKDFNIVNMSYWRSRKPNVLAGFSCHLDHPTKPYFLFALTDWDKNNPGCRLIRGMPLKVNAKEAYINMGWWNMGYSFSLPYDVYPVERPYCIVGAGYRYALVGVERSDHMASVHFIELTDAANFDYSVNSPMEKICRVNLPSQYKIYGRGAVYCAGDISWLSGMTGTNTRGTAFAAASGNKVLLLNWKQTLSQLSKSAGSAASESQDIAKTNAESSG